MIKVAASVLVMLSLGAAPPPKVTAELPIPIEYQGDDYAVVFFTSNIEIYCGVNPDPRLMTLACANSEKRAIAMPNPCRYTHEYYARIMCHEKAHISGWRH